MKKLLFLFLSISLLACSSNSDPDAISEQTLKFNGKGYEFDHVYVQKIGSEAFYVMLTKGAITIDTSTPSNEITFSDSFKRLVAFMIKSSSIKGTHNFPLTTNPNILGNTISFTNNYTISNGQPSNFDIVFWFTDNMNTQSRVIVTEFSEDKYSFDFNVITTAGILTGNYQGNIIKVDY